MEKTTHTFVLTDKEMYLLQDAISTKLIEIYESYKECQSDEDLNKRYKGYVEQLELIKGVHEAIKGTSADKFLAIYEDVLSGENGGLF